MALDVSSKEFVIQMAIRKYKKIIIYLDYKAQL